MALTLTLIRTLSLISVIAVGSQAWAAQEGDGKGKAREHGDLRAKALEKFDANHDGKLDESERASAKEAMKERMGKAKEHMGEHRGTIFDKIDANHDGSISREEFMAAKREHGGKQGDK